MSTTKNQLIQSVLDVIRDGSRIDRRLVRYPDGSMDVTTPDEGRTGCDELTIAPGYDTDEEAAAYASDLVEYFDLHLSRD